MKWNVALLVAFLVMLPFVSSRAEEPPDTVMGNWEGTWTGEVFGSGALYAQVIAEGKGNYRAVVSADTGETEPVRGELRGGKQGEKVALEGTVDAGPGAGVSQAAPVAGRGAGELARLPHLRAYARCAPPRPGLLRSGMRIRQRCV